MKFISLRRYVLRGTLGTLLISGVGAATMLSPQAALAQETPAQTPANPAVPATRGSVPDLSALEKPPLPSGPILHRMGDSASWEIAYVYDTDKPPKVAVEGLPVKEGGDSVTPPPPPSAYPVPNERLRRITVTRTKPYWCSVSVDINGHSYTQWSDGTEMYLEPPKKSEAPIIASKIDRLNFTDFSRNDFPDMQWVAPATYVGVQALENVPCLVFRKDDMIVWIRQDSRFPARWKREGETRNFRNLPRPASVLTFPPSVAKLSDALKADRQFLAKPVPRGG